MPQERIYTEQCPEPIMGFKDVHQQLLKFGKIYLIILKLYLFLHLLNSISATSLTAKYNNDNWEGREYDYYVSFLPNYYQMQLIDVNNIVYLCKFVNFLIYYY